MSHSPPSPIDVVAEATPDEARALALEPNLGDKIELTARWILREFDAYYVESRRIPALAQQAFEQRDHKASLHLSQRRLSMYSASIGELGPRLKEAFPEVAEDEDLWDEVEARYVPMIRGRYHADLAYAYLYSVRRRISQGEWKPVDYGFGDSREGVADGVARVFRVFPCRGRISREIVAEILTVPGFSTPYRDIDEDARLIAERAEHELFSDGRTPDAAREVHVVDAGFYRNRGAYIVGRVVGDDQDPTPFIIALLNDEKGIYADALLTSQADAHNIFSSTLANFHVTNSYYHELARFLHSIMPKRPLGLHYSTIGFNHVGKVAVMNELKEELLDSGERFETAVGYPGTVAIAFSSPSSAYILKVIRDHPTSQYKWGKFEGIESVLAKYARVHEINRTGSMLDNIIYYNLKLERSWFDRALLRELLEKAGKTVYLQGEAVIFKYLIVQRRMQPLPVFLEHASPADAEAAIVNLGYCIKNNAAANIFNKDLDARNYGVSRYLKVYLFDYDALEPFTDVKIRSNADRVEGEEDVPDWFFEDGVVFLPEEIEAGLCLRSRPLRRLFRDRHTDLLTTGYWERVQQALLDDKVPSVRIYAESRELRRE